MAFETAPNDSAIQDAVGLRARGPYRRPLARIQRAELDSLGAIEAEAVEEDPGSINPDTGLYEEKLFELDLSDLDDESLRNRGQTP